MGQNQEQDPLWQTAWAWVRREHERTGFDEAASAQLKTWLAADPAHRNVYAKASRLWLLAGLVPPANEIDLPDAEPAGS